MVKRTYQPKKGKRVSKHGYRLRKSTRSGRNVLKSRRLKGRKKISI